MFSVRIDTSLTLAGLLQLGKNHSLIKTPHVGNIYMNNLIFAQIGVPLIMVDRNVGSRDKNFHPHLCIVGGKQYQIASPDDFSLAGRIKYTPAPVARYFYLGEHIDAAHMRNFRAAIPGLRARTLTETFTQFKSTIGPLATHLLKRFTKKHYRYLHPSGQVERVIHSHPSAGAGVVGFDATVESGGYLAHNDIVILLDTIRSFLETGSTYVVDLSGPNMYEYVTKSLPSIQEMYEDLTRTFKWIPTSFDVVMTPVHNLRFAVPESKTAELHTLVTRYKHHSAIEAELVARIRSAHQLQAKITARELVQAKFQARAQANAEYARLGSALKHEVFYSIEEGKHFTHYDLLASKEQLYVHPVNYELSPVQAEEIVKRVQLAMNHTPTALSQAA